MSAARPRPPSSGYGTVFNQVTEVRDFDYGGVALLRSTRTQYQNSANYTNRHIFNLPLTVEVYAPDGFTRLPHTDYQYDGQTLFDAPGVVMHQDSSNPYAPPVWVDGYWEWNCDAIDQPCFQYWVPGYWQTVYDPSTDFRGNVTQVTSYADAINLTGAMTQTRRYDITSNLVILAGCDKRRRSEQAASGISSIRFMTTWAACRSSRGLIAMARRSSGAPQPTMHLDERKQ
ncbi:MAG TPA: hypothetical protein VHD88_02875 [Pyrinomonadaceae bacterium]|nr:hypothetical protein [Pyrinomonadaceae bacterium]